MPAITRTINGDSGAPVRVPLRNCVKPHFSFRDLDENRPLASIRIRIETMHYFLERYQQSLKRSIRGIHCSTVNLPGVNAPAWEDRK